MTDHSPLLRLCAILHAELEGRPLDRDEARQLASSLCDGYPGIAATLQRISERMTAQRAA